MKAEKKRAEKKDNASKTKFLTSRRQELSSRVLRYRDDLVPLIKKIIDKTLGQSYDGTMASESALRPEIGSGRFCREPALTPSPPPWPDSGKKA
ncbi:hypothetical protein PoB_000693400 [Plakobranchus ocellatus]|uniref:Uncharacterized protein n=1 Tax=Plakobranchus ocellatus TaxID=259542 RepID=A0AAV3YBP0_9GAST|nr:hypothetical protein PoB_000693400 [Plakobranchus ocellatus]